MSDNASTDGTKGVAKCGDPRVRYHRNPRNLGAAANFALLVEVAQGEYFSWLQDDDLLYREYARRAHQAFKQHPTAVAYACYAMVTPNVRSVVGPWLYGPPLPLDWCNGTATLFDGRLITPLSLLTSVAIPPVIAFRTQVLRECLQAACSDKCDLHWERILFALIGTRGPIVVEPFVGGIYRAHAEQSWKQLSAKPGEEERDWRIMAGILDGLARSWNPDWQDLFRETLRECDASARSRWAKETRNWPVELEICRTVKRILDDHMVQVEDTCEASGDRGAVPQEHPAKAVLRDVTPPVIWRALRLIRRGYCHR